MLEEVEVDILVVAPERDIMLVIIQEDGGGSFYTGTGSYAKGGWESMPSTSGGTETGHSGNGYARITLVE